MCASIPRTDRYDDALDHTGATSLVYGTVEEFGMGMRPLDAPLPECADAQNYTARLICGANRLLRDRFPRAILHDAAREGRTFTAAWTSYIVDPADAQYKTFLLENTIRVRDELGGNGSARGVGGVCLDRGDYIRLVNRAADDGVSATADGRPARALVNSWRQVVPQIGALLHSAAHKALALYVNPDSGHRVDMYEGVDGIFDEMGDASPGAARTASGWLVAGGKPGIIWCHDPAAGSGMNATQCGALMTNGSDAVRHRFLQSHLLYGLFPSVPVADNDHQIQPAPRADALYERYGPLWLELRAKRWLTTAHAVEVLDPLPSAKAARAAPVLMANAFERQPYGSGQYAVSLAFGVRGNATVRLALLPQHATPQMAVSASAMLLDGVRVACTCVVRPQSGLVDVTVSLGDEGCAVVTVTVHGPRHEIE